MRSSSPLQRWKRSTLEVSRRISDAHGDALRDGRIVEGVADEDALGKGAADLLGDQLQCVGLALEVVSGRVDTGDHVVRVELQTVDENMIEQLVRVRDLAVKEGVDPA